MAHRIHTGIQFCYRNRGLSLGILSGGERVLPGKKALDMLEKTPVISWHHNLSLHGNWYRNRIQVFGELAASGYSSLALLLGARYQFNDFIQGILHLHHYGSGYRGSLPSSYASGSQIRNEHGLAFHLFMESGRSLIIKLNGELFRYPAPRYLTEVPSEGFRLDLSLENPGNKTIYWRARLTSKIWQTTPALGNSPIRPLLNSSVHRIDGKLACEVHDRFRWLSRFVLGYCVHKQHASTGYAAVQQLTCHAGPVVITAQCVLFHIEDWANRIYLHEPGFYYSFNFPVYNGSGQKSILLLTCKPLNALKVSFKISHTRKQGNHHVASGIQLRVSF